MNELLNVELKLINGGSQESYESGEDWGYKLGRIFKAIGFIVDAFSPAA